MLKVKRSLLVICSLSAILTGCASTQMTWFGQGNESKDTYVITQVDNPEANYMSGGGKVKITYTDYATRLAEKEEKIKNELLTEKDANLQRESLAKGGDIIVNIFRNTIEAATLKYFSYILLKNGKEVMRVEAGQHSSALNSIPEVPSRSGIDGAFWTNMDIIDIHDKFEKDDELKLLVLDKLNNKRDEFVLTYKKEVKKP